MQIPTKSWKFKAFSYGIIFLITLIIGSYFRTYPLRTHQSKDNRGKATLLVMSRLKKQVDLQVAANYPKADEQQKALLRKQLLTDLMQSENDKIQESIAKVERNIEKTAGPQRDTPYLLAADSFHFYQLTERLIEEGNISDTIEGSKYLNELMLAPKGHLEPITWHPHIGALTHHLTRMFRANTSLMESVGYTPIILTAIALVSFLWACATMQSRLWSTWIGAIFFICSPIFIKRSAWGWYDNDPYNTIFPLLALALTFTCFKNSDSKIKMVINLVLLSLVMLVYAYFWQGWMLMFGVVSGGIFMAVAYSWIIDKQKNLAINETTLLGGFGLLTFLLIAVFFGGREFFTLFQEGFHALKNFLQPQLSVWPDLYISVGELHQTSLFEVIIITGGITFFSIACIGLIGTWTSWKSPSRSLNHKISLTLTLFLALAIVITLGAQRFALLCLTPIALLFVMGLSQIEDFLDKLTTHLKNRKAATPTLIFSRLTMAALIAIPISTLNRQMPKLLNPIYNDTWHAAMVDIEERTPQNSIINTWWPPGHFVKATGKRKVTFDGATINYPQAYWLTRSYLAQSEQESLGILRMLNTSANDAADYLESLGLRTSSAVAVLRAVTSLNSRQARLLLETKIPDSNKVIHLLKLTHRKPPPSYIFIYRDLVEKNIQLAFIGNWNFNKIEELNENPSLLSQVPDRSSKEYVQFLWKLAGGPYKYNTPLVQMGNKDAWMIFDQGIRINQDSKLCIINSEKFGKGIPQSIFFVKDGNVVEQQFDNASLGYSVTLFEESGKKYVVLMDRYLAKSMIMRLFYFGDRGMKYVKNFTQRADLSKRTDIRIFEVDWTAFQKDFQ